MWLTALSALAAIFSNVQANTKCSTEPADVMFVLRSDSPRNQTLFDQQLDVIQTFVNNTKLPMGDIRVGLIHEADHAVLDMHLDDHLDVTELSLALRFVTFHPGLTSTGVGLDYILQHGMDQGLGGRQGARDVIIYISAGPLVTAGVAVASSQKLQDNGTTVIALGTTGPEDLATVASGNHYSVVSTQPLSVQELATAAVDLTCDALNGVPALDCSEVPVDIVFLLDASSDQGKDDFVEQVNYARSLLVAALPRLSSNMTRVAQVTYATFSQVVFGLDAHPDTSELFTVMGWTPFQGGERRVEEGLRYISDHIFPMTKRSLSSSSVLRPNSRKIVIVTSTGPQTNPQLAAQESVRLQARGVAIISVGVAAAITAEVTSLASQSHYSLTAADFDELEGREAEESKLICEAIVEERKNVPSTAQPTSSTSPMTVSAAPLGACEFSPCYNGGLCTSHANNSFTCDCPPTHSGVWCQTENPTSAPDHRCSINPCFNGGSCKIEGDHLLCVCPPQYTGVVCEVELKTTTVSTTPQPTTTVTTTTSTTQASTTAKTSTTQASTTTTASQVTTTSPLTTSAPQQLQIADTLVREGCQKSEIVFLIEHIGRDSQHDVDHEADFVVNMVEQWRIDDNHVRVGVVTYSDEIKEIIHLDDYSGDKNAMIDKLEHLAEEAGGAGNVPVTDAMHYVTNNMYKDHNSRAQKVAVVMIRRMNAEARRRFADEVQRMNSRGIKVYGLGVDLSDADRALMQANVDQFHEFSSWDNLEHSLDNNFHLRCH